MTAMINSAYELADYFWFCGALKGRKHSIMVSTKIRKDFLISSPQGLVTINNGRREVVEWKNIGGGVWEASVFVPEVK